MVGQDVLDRRCPDIRQSPAGEPAAIEAANFTTPRRTGSGSASIAPKTALSRLQRLATGTDRFSGPGEDNKVVHAQPLCDHRLQADAASFLIER